MRVLSFLYGVVVYVIAFAAFCYLIGFVGNFLVPKSIDSGAPEPISYALLINTLVLAVFAVQHSLMARPWFKAWWTKLVPSAVERSTYVLFTSLALFLIYWKWEVMPQPVWIAPSGTVTNLIWVIFGFGWLIVFASTFMISHWDLFGLRQVWHRLRDVNPTPLEFKKRWLYALVRHPLLLGFLIAFWAIPSMTVGHLYFSLVMTGYIVIGIYFEERELLAAYGDSYAQYRNEVRALVPLPKKVAR